MEINVKHSNRLSQHIRQIVIVMVMIALSFHAPVSSACIKSHALDKDKLDALGYDEGIAELEQILSRIPRLSPKEVTWVKEEINGGAKRKAKISGTDEYLRYVSVSHISYLIKLSKEAKKIRNDRSSLSWTENMKDYNFNTNAEIWYLAAMSASYLDSLQWTFESLSKAGYIDEIYWQASNVFCSARPKELNNEIMDLSSWLSSSLP